MKKFNLEQFEFSQSFVYYYDKIERANYFLDLIIGTTTEPVEGRLIEHLLKDPIQDGGQWDMFVNLVLRYGLVPKSVYPDSHSSTSSRPLNWLLTVKLREFAKVLRETPKQDQQQMKQKMMEDVYRIVTISLGLPPSQFEWNFRDKDKKFHSFNLTPQSFYQMIEFPLEDYVSLIHDPRHSFNQLLTVKFLGNMSGMPGVKYINVDLETLKKSTISSLKADEACWHGCDVGKHHDRTSGVLDIGLLDYERAFGINFNLSKKERLEFGESILSHAMLITGVHLQNEVPVRWRIENSWGEDKGKKGYLCMTDKWFDEYNFQVVLNKKYVPELVHLLDTEPLVLEPWDPLAHLAE